MVSFYDGGISKRVDKIMKDVDKKMDDVNKQISQVEQIIENTGKAIDDITQSVGTQSYSKNNPAKVKVSKMDNSINVRIDHNKRSSSTHVILDFFSHKSTTETREDELTSNQSKLKKLHQDIKKEWGKQSRVDKQIDNIINDNYDIFAVAIFSKTGLRAWFRAFLDLRIYYKENQNYDYMISERLLSFENKVVPLNLMETVSKCFPEELMTECVIHHNDITFNTFGFNNKVLVNIYTHYIKNRKRLLAGNIQTKQSIVETDAEKQEKLTQLVKSFYK